MNDINVMGVDLAKSIFQVCAQDQEGNIVFNRRMKRNAFSHFMTKLPPQNIAMEACGSAHYWGRLLKEKGHQVQLIHPKKVKPFVDRNKNDVNDAEAIGDAARCKRIASIPVKSLNQHSLCTLHSARKKIIQQRVQSTNQLRSQLAEYGLIAPCGYAALKKLVRNVLAGECTALPEVLLFVFQDLYDTWKKLDERVKAYDEHIKRIAHENLTTKKLLQLPGIGELTATAFLAKVEDMRLFKKGKTLSAWLGLTPRVYASADKCTFGRISKQGDRYLRSLLIHGARSAIYATLRTDNRSTAYHRWIHQLVERVGKNKAAVALANKHARMIWALLYHGRKLDLNIVDSYTVEAMTA